MRRYLEIKEKIISRAFWRAVGFAIGRLLFNRSLIPAEWCGGVCPRWRGRSALTYHH
jgi:hypothetical protein